MKEEIKNMDKVELESELTEAKYNDYEAIFDKYGLSEGYKHGKKKSELIQAALDQFDKVKELKEEEEKKIEEEISQEEVETNEPDPADDFNITAELPHKVEEGKDNKEAYEKQLANIKLCLMNANNENKRNILKRKMYELEDKLK